MKSQDDCRPPDGSRTDADAAAPGFPETHPAESPPPPDTRLDRHFEPWTLNFGLGVLLLVATLLAYQPAWNGQPVYDDDDHLTPPELQSLAGLARIWTELGVVSQYYPVAHTAFWLQAKLWGHWMPGYHFVNLLLHALAALLLVRVLRRLEIPGAWLAAGLFALHPVMAESVAWISELKNTLSTVFYLGAALAYLQFDAVRRQNSGPETRNSNPRNPNEIRNPKPEEGSPPDNFKSQISNLKSPAYLLALFLFIAGLLSKSVIASLPAALLVVFWWKRGRLSWKQDVLPLLPFFAAALAMGILTAWVEKKFIGAQGEDFNLSLLERCLIAGRVVWFYLGKLAWPANLIFIYPRWQVSAAVWWQYLFPAAALLLVAAAWALRRRGRGPLAALLFFGGTLFPALGFINVYPFRYSFVADHYVYLAALGPIVLAAAGISRGLTIQNSKFKIQNSTLPCLALLLTLATLTWRQCHIYRDVETLWRTTLGRNPACFVAYSNLGNHLLGQGRADEAIELCRKALELRPGFAEPHNNLANALLRKGRTDEALAQYRQALEIRPDLAVVHCNIGYILLQRGQADEALACFQKAVELRPEFVQAHVHLGNVLLQQGRSDEATARLRVALKLRPDDPEVRSSLGNALLQQGDLDEAIVHFQKALEVRPDDAKSHNDLGIALVQKGRVEDALSHYRKALAIQPDFDLAHYNLGFALLQKGEPDQAMAHFQKAVEVQPNLAAAHFQLGNLLLEKGRVDEAITRYEQALAIQPDLADAHLNLASALLQKGRVQEVLAHCRAALKLQPDNPQILSNLAWVLATWPEASVRNGAEAIELARRADRLCGGRDPLALRALAAAYAEAGRFTEALASARQALKLAADQGNAGLAEALRSELKLLEAGSPLRNP